MRLRKNQKGIALLVVIMVIITLAMAAAFSMSVGYNQNNVINAAGGKRVVVENAAQAGMIDAMWRIRTSYLGPTTFTPGGLAAAPDPTGPNLFDKPINRNYTPRYNMDLNADNVIDAVVTISAWPALGTQRTIDSVGCGDTRIAPCP